MCITFNFKLIFYRQLLQPKTSNYTPLLTHMHTADRRMSSGRRRSEWPPENIRKEKKKKL
jgi:hypothetical protein